MVLGGLAGLVGSILGGLKWGELLRAKQRWRYWFANLLVMALGSYLAYSGLVGGRAWLSAAGLGIMGGGITGLKYGLGVSAGVWRTVDRITRTDDLPKV